MSQRCTLRPSSSITLAKAWVDGLEPSVATRAFISSYTSSSDRAPTAHTSLTVIVTAPASSAVTRQTASSARRRTLHRSHRHRRPRPQSARRQNRSRGSPHCAQRLTQTTEQGLTRTNVALRANDQDRTHGHVAAQKHGPPANSPHSSAPRSDSGATRRVAPSARRLLKIRGEGARV